MLRRVGDLAIAIVAFAPHAIIESSAQTVSLVLDGSAVAGGIALPPGTATYRSEPLTAGAGGCTVVQVTAGTSRFGLRRPCTVRVSDYAIIGERIRGAMRRSDAAAPLAVRSAALHLVGRVLQLLTAPEWLLAAREVIASHFRQTPADVAAAIGVPVVTLNRAFRRQFGESVAGAIRAARIEAAVDELRRSKVSTAEIARGCGFYDASHLIRSLDAAAGLRPAAFREQW